MKIRRIARCSQRSDRPAEVRRDCGILAAPRFASYVPCRARARRSTRHRARTRASSGPSQGDERATQCERRLGLHLDVPRPRIRTRHDDAPSLRHRLDHGTFIIAWMVPNLLRRLLGEGALSAALFARLYPHAQGARSSRRRPATQHCQRWGAGHSDDYCHPRLAGICRVARPSGSAPPTQKPAWARLSPATRCCCWPRS